MDERTIIGLLVGGSSFLLGALHWAGVAIPGSGSYENLLAKLLLPLGAVIIYMALFC